MRKSAIFLLVGVLLVSSCKKKNEDEGGSGGGGGTSQVADIHGNWVGKWTNSQSGDYGLIHLSIEQSAETVSIQIIFDSMNINSQEVSDTFLLEGRLDEDHISGYAISTREDTFKCVFSLSYANDTLHGTYNFGPGTSGSWWAVRGTHLVEIGWNYFGEIAGYPNDVFFSQDRILYIASTNGLYSSLDYGINFELVDTTAFYSLCDAGGVLYGAGFGFVLKSSDGGNTWQDITPSGFVGGSGTIIRFEDNNNGYIFTGDDVYATTDGGSTWTLHENVLPGLVQGAYVNSNGLYVSGYIPGQTIGGFAAVSTDGGSTWNLLDIPQDDSVGEVWSIYAEGNYVVMGGKKVKSETDDHDLRIVLYSDDNGNTFTKETFTDTPPHDEWIGAVLYHNGTLYAGNVYPTGNVIVYSFGSETSADTLPYTGGSSRAFLDYGDGNLGLVITTSSGNSVVYYYKSN